VESNRRKVKEYHWQMIKLLLLVSQSHIGREREREKVRADWQSTRPMEKVCEMKMKRNEMKKCTQVVRVDRSCIYGGLLSYLVKHDRLDEAQI